MIWITGAGLSVSGALFAWALVLITRKQPPLPAPLEDEEWKRKYYENPMTQEEIEYFNQARWD